MNSRLDIGKLDDTKKPCPGAMIYDLDGRKVLQESLDMSLNRNVINANELNTGVYVLKLQNGNQNISKKVILK